MAILLLLLIVGKKSSSTVGAIWLYNVSDTGSVTGSLAGTGGVAAPLVGSSPRMARAANVSPLSQTIVQLFDVLTHQASVAPSPPVM